MEGSAPEVDAKLGEQLWAPPPEYHDRLAGRRSGARLATVGLFAGAAVLALAAAFTAVPGSYETATGLSALGGLLALGGTWSLVKAGRSHALAVGVFERGVIMPASFESGPGLGTVKGPVAILRGEIDRVEEMRHGEERAIVVWSKAGRPGLLSARMEEFGVSGPEAHEILAGFTRALGEWGIEVRQTSAPPDAEGG